MVSQGCPKGMGGIGKTSLAAAYTWSAVDAGMFTLLCDDAAVLKESLRSSRRNSSTFSPTSASTMARKRGVRGSKRRGEHHHRPPPPIPLPLPPPAAALSIAAMRLSAATRYWRTQSQQ